jgi:DNA modification methylase
VITIGNVTVHHGNCLDILPTLPDCSVDSVVTDPPYELGFMGKKWDASGIAYNVTLWSEVMRVLKPGGHLLAFGGTRTYHRMAVAIEDAGFEIRDSIHYMYGSGFPKSLNVKKSAKDKACQCEILWSHGYGHPLPEHDLRPVRDSDIPEAVGLNETGGEVLLSGVSEQGLPVESQKGAKSEVGGAEQSGVEGGSDFREGEGQLHRPEVRQVSSGVDRNGSVRRLHNGASPSDGPVGWQASGEDGSGEPHQPESSGQSTRKLRTVPEQRRPQAWGGWPVCGGCSKPILPEGLGTSLKPAHEPVVVARRPLIGTVAANVLQHGTGALNIDGTRVGGASGRWPANVIFDPDAATELDRQSGVSKAGAPRSDRGTGGIWAEGNGIPVGPQYGDTGGASRFFYIAKPSKAERNAGLEESSTHPTVKPLTLMRYLVRLVTPPGGTVLEPFAGSGTTLMAATMEGFNSIGIEMTDDYLPIIEGRVRWAQTQQQELPL